MRYCDFDKHDQKLILEFLGKLNEAYYPEYGYASSAEELQDNEVFFDTYEHMLAVTEEYLDNPGSYGDMARELREYFSGGDGWEVVDLGWGYIARVPDGRYLVCSNSWSDSGLFLYN